MALTDVAIKKLKAEGKPIKVADEKGLFLLVKPTGAKLWHWKYRFQGREKLMAIGGYPEISLAEAREKRDQGRKHLISGVDPMGLRREAKVARQIAMEDSFEAVARSWWGNWKTARSSRHADYVKRRLEADVFPIIGHRPVGELQALELVAMAKRIEARGALDIAKRSMQTCGQVFRYAIAHGKASRNPATDVRPSDVLPPRKKTNYARVDARELPDLLRKIEVYQGASITRAALKLMAMTFVRTSELIGARWQEFDLDAGRWDIPAERMKMKTPHIVPLSAQAVTLLRALHTSTGGRAMLFPGERDPKKPMSNNTILKALERMGYKGRMTGHGFRGVASTILHEQGFEHSHIELQLAHQERNAVSASYNHAQHLEQRAGMMQAWSDYLDACIAGNVVPLRKLGRDGSLRQKF